MFLVFGSFIIGYSIGYYSCDLFKPKKPRNEIRDEIIDFVLSYNNKHGIINKKARRHKNQL